jgi:hypothetical protein
MAFWRERWIKGVVALDLFDITCSPSRYGCYVRSTFSFLGFDGLESGKGRMLDMVGRIAQERYRT